MIAAIIDANHLTLASDGSPLIYPGESLTIPDLTAVGSGTYSQLSAQGDAIVAKNQAGLWRLANTVTGTNTGAIIPDGATYFGDDSYGGGWTPFTINSGASGQNNLVAEFYASLPQAPPFTPISDLGLGNPISPGDLIAGPAEWLLSLGLESLGKLSLSAFLNTAAESELTAADIISSIAQQQANLGVNGLSEYMSDGQLAAYLANPAAGSRFLGTAVHDATADVLGSAYPGRFVYSTIGPDFTDMTTGELIELTTPGQVASHLARPGYNGVTISTYTLP
jgi:hypothetical protein